MNLVRHLYSSMHKTCQVVVALGILLLSAACDDGGINPALEGFYEVNPVFRSFYDELGGLDVMGPAISSMVTDGGVNYQYTASGLMVNDPQAAGKRTFQLAPLSLELGVLEPPLVSPKTQDNRYVSGHYIFSEFLDFYNTLGGMRIIGPPITEVHYNPIYGRYEQYFENLGLFLKKDDLNGSPHLLSIGAWKCGAPCRELPKQYFIAIPSRVYPVTGAFAKAVNRLGPHFTGFAISEVFTAPDGFQEQVFENMVLYIDPEQGKQVRLRPITQAIGILPMELVPNSNAADSYFYPERGDKGYNVLLRFWDYLATHGGLDASGPPISEMAPWERGLNRQCFLNLCLLEDPAENGVLRVHPDPLGYLYLEVIGMEVDPTPTPEVGEAEVDNQNESEATAEQPRTEETAPTPEEKPANRELSLQVWKVNPAVAPDQSQEIGASVMEGNVPVRNIEPELVITLPDGATQTYLMNPTGEDGQTRLLISPINAPNGTLIQYQVCIRTQNGERFCVRDNYLIMESS